MSKIPFGKPFPGIDPASLKEGMASGLVNGFINETAVDVESIPGQGLFVTLETLVHTGGIGTARHFNGIPNLDYNSFEHLAGPSTSSTFNQWSFIAWVLRDSVGTINGIHGRLFDANVGWGVGVDGNNLLFFKKDTQVFSVPCPDIVSQWSVIAVTYDRFLASDHVKFYWGRLPSNFALIGTATADGAQFAELSTFGRHIGDISNAFFWLGWNPWNGWIDNLRTWRAALPIEDLILAMYPESDVRSVEIEDRVDIIGTSPEQLLKVNNFNEPYGYIVVGEDPIMTGPGVGAGILAPGGTDVIEVGPIDGLYETLSGVVLAVTRGRVFQINADASFTEFTGPSLNSFIYPYFAEDGQNVFISHGGKIARVDLTLFTVELLNQNTPNNVTHICRAKGYLLCNGDDTLITSSIFDLSQVFDNAPSLEAVVVLRDQPKWIVATAQGQTTGPTTGTARIYLSKDNGITWSKRYTESQAVFIQALEYMGGGIVLAGTGAGVGKILRSTNYGQSWGSVQVLGSATYVHFIKKLTGNIVIAGTGNGPGQGRLWRSTDYGETWVDIGVAFGEQVTAGEALTDSGAIVEVAVIANFDNFTGLANIRVWRSTNTGSTFVQLAQSFDGADYTTFIQRITNTVSIMSNGQTTLPTDQKIWRSADVGATWILQEPIPGFAPGAMPFASTMMADGSVLIGTAGNSVDPGGAQIWKSIDLGLTWFLVTILSEEPAAAIAPYGLKETHVLGTVIATGRIGLEDSGKTPAAKWQTAVGRNTPQGDVFFSEDVGNGYEALESWERFNAQAVPDAVNGVFTHRGLVYSPGIRSLEMNYSSGDPEFPWAVSDPALPYGLLAPNSWVSWDELDTIMYLTSTDKGVKVVQLQGRQQKGISDEYDQILNDRDIVTQPDAAKAWGITIRGLRFYVISFPWDNLTLIYNLQQDHWARWAFWNGTEYEAALINAYCYSNAYKRHFIGDRRSTGKVFTLDLNNFTDDGMPIVFEYTSGHVSRGGDSAKFPARYLGKYKRGYSIDNTVPEVLLSWRDDGRGTFSTERVLSLGATGENEFYTHANRLGMYRLRQWRQRAFLSKCRLIFAQADES